MAEGDIAPWQEASISADEGGLRITALKANVGDAVHQGQVLVEFDDAAVRQAEQGARASVAEAEAASVEAAASAQRARRLDGSGAFSQQEAERFYMAERSAMARLESARAALEAQRIRLAHTRLLAPDDGVVSSRAAVLGQVVQPGTELFRLVRQGRLEWRAEVTAEQLAQITPGQLVRMTLPAPDDQPATEIEGRVRQLAPTIDPRTRRALVYVDLPAGTAARAGMYVRGRLQGGQRGALTIPRDALLMHDGLPHVMRLQEDDTVRLTRVETGRLAGDEMEITAGLEAGERIVLRGAAFLSDGDPVRVVDELPDRAVDADDTP